MMGIRLNKLQSRDITINSGRFLKSPNEKILDIRSGYLIAIKRQDNTAIMVVYDLVEEHIDVVTAFKVSEVDRLIRSRVGKGY